MPHVIYLHSSLTQHLHGGSRQQRYSATKWDVAIAMTIAGFVNLAMMATAAAAFHFSGHTGVADLDEAYLTLQPLLSHAAATVLWVKVWLLPDCPQRWWGHWRAGGDAGIHSLPYPAVGASYSHHVAVIYCHSDGIRSDTDSGYESGAV